MVQIPWRVVSEWWHTPNGIGTQEAYPHRTFQDVWEGSGSSLNMDRISGVASFASINQRQQDLHITEYSLTTGLGLMGPVIGDAGAIGQIDASRLMEIGS